MGDTLAGMHAAFGVLLSLIHRLKDHGAGQVVDVAIYESMFNMMEAVVPEYDGAGLVREASGTTVTGIVPTNTYRCRDGKYVVIGGNGDSIFKRLMEAAGHPEMAADPRLAHNAGRVEHEQLIDTALAEWTAGLDSTGVLEVLRRAEVPSGPIYSVQEMVEDPHYQARGMFEPVDIGGRELKLPAISPRLSETPGATDWAGCSEAGSHNREVLADLGIDEDEQARLRERGII